MHFGSAAIPVGWRHAWTTGVVAAVTSSAGQEAAARLAGTRFADVRWVDETGSTNADVLGLARDGEAEGIVVVADHQTAGRGRLGRTWTAAPGTSLLTTVLLRPPAAVANATTMAVAVALTEAVAEVTGVDVRIKWPNDLVSPGDGTEVDHKVAGILAEVDWPAGSQASGGWPRQTSGEPARGGRRSRTQRDPARRRARRPRGPGGVGRRAGRSPGRPGRAARRLPPLPRRAGTGGWSRRSTRPPSAPSGSSARPRWAVGCGSTSVRPTSSGPPPASPTRGTSSSTRSTASSGPSPSATSIHLRPTDGLTASRTGPQWRLAAGLIDNVVRVP